MAKEVKAATLTVTELVNATEVASIEQSNTNNMEKKEISKYVCTTRSEAYQYF